MLNTEADYETPTNETIIQVANYIAWYLPPITESSTQTEEYESFAAENQALSRENSELKAAIKELQTNSKTTNVFVTLLLISAAYGAYSIGRILFNKTTTTIQQRKVVDKTKAKWLSNHHLFKQ